MLPAGQWDADNGGSGGVNTTKIHCRAVKCHDRTCYYVSLENADTTEIQDTMCIKLLRRLPRVSEELTGDLKMFLLYKGPVESCRSVTLS